MVIFVKELKNDGDQFRDKKRREKHRNRKIIINMFLKGTINVLTDKNSKKYKRDEAIEGKKLGIQLSDSIIC